MKKLIQINATCNWGSTGRIAEQIALLAIENGWDCYIVHGSRYKRPSQVISIEVGTTFSDWIHAFNSKLWGWHGLGSRYATRHLIKKLESIKPDIIHLHNIHGYYINYPILFQYLKKENIPVVWTLHDCWSMTGHCTHFEMIGCDRWKSICYNCPQKQAQYGTILLNRSRRNYLLKKKYFTSITKLTLVPVSQWLAGIVAQSFLQNAKIQVINNGINLDIFKPQPTKLRDKLNIPNSKHILLGVATDWDHEKGLPEFIELSKNSNFQIILIGLTEGQIKKLPKEIIGIQRTANQQELVEYYCCADILVNPTYNDTFPTVNIEALACGTPVVTYRTGGSPEILSPETGIVVEKGNYTELVKAIETVLENGKEHYSQECIARATQNYNQNERFQDYIRLYNELIKK